MLIIIIADIIPITLQGYPHGIRIYFKSLKFEDLQVKIVTIDDLAKN